MSSESSKDIKSSKDSENRKSSESSKNDMNEKIRKKYFGKYLSKQRKRMHLTQEELASKLNVSKSAIAKWETDGGVPDRDNLKLLADVLGVNVDRLYGIIDGRFPKESAASEAEYIVDEFISILEKHGYTVDKY